MTTKIIAITSKNQITIPADIVRDLQLNRQRRLTLRRRGDELILKALPDLEEQLSSIWEQLPSAPGTKDNHELKATSEEAWEHKIV